MRARYDDGGPDHPDPPCEVCCYDVDRCICAECPECGTFGDPKCYEEHNLVRTEEQTRHHDEMHAAWEAMAKAESDPEFGNWGDPQF